MTKPEIEILPLNAVIHDDPTRDNPCFCQRPECPDSGTPSRVYEHITHLSSGLALGEALSYLPGAGYTIDAEAVTQAIGELTYGQSRAFVARDAYGDTDIVLTIGYTGNGTTGGRFFWRVATA